MCHAPGPACSGRRIRAAGSVHAERVTGPGARRGAAAASTTVSAASSASVGVPRTTRNSARRSSGVASARTVPGHSVPGRLPGHSVVGHRGMFPCLRVGAASRFVASARSARPTYPRVWEGGMTPSTYPRSAAMYGLASVSS